MERRPEGAVERCCAGRGSRRATCPTYLFAAPASGGTDSVEVNTHAWLEALIPAADEGAPAWVGADPTNRTLASARHVKIGHGRSYADVPPVKGVYRGAGSSTYDARVEMRRLDGTATARP